MSGPPKDVEPEDLFRRLLERPAPAEEMRWPGRDQEFDIRIEVLRKQQIDDCRLKAQRWWDQGMGKAQEQQGLLAREIVADRVACEILSVAVKRTKAVEGTEETGKPQYPRLFASADDVRKALFPDEVEILWNAYHLTQEKYGPWEESISTPEERNAWVAKLAQGGSAYPLLALRLPQLLKLTVSLCADRILLSGAMVSLLPELPPHWASALQRLVIGTTSSSWPRVECTEQDGLQIRWEDAEPAELPPNKSKDYIDVRQLAAEIAHETRMAAFESGDDES